MEKQSIIIIRDQLKDYGIRIFAAEDLLFNSEAKHTKLVWDDVNTLLYAFRPNNSHYNQDSKRINVTTIEYSALQCLNADLNREELIALLNKMKADGITDDIIIKEIIESYDNLNSKLL